MNLWGSQLTTRRDGTVEHDCLRADHAHGRSITIDYHLPTQPQFAGST
jgi:hypothetical protein